MKKLLEFSSRCAIAVAFLAFKGNPRLCRLQNTNKLQLPPFEKLLLHLHSRQSRQDQAKPIGEERVPQDKSLSLDWQDWRSL